MNNQTEQFDRYLQNKMSEEEVGKFQELLREDMELRKAFEDHRLAIEMISVAKGEEIKRKLSAFESPASKGKVVSMNLRFLYAAAMIIVLVGVVTVWQLSGPASPGELYASYYTLEQGPGQVRGNSETLPAWKSFQQAYNTGDFTTAIDHLESCEDLGCEPLYLVRYYHGICLMNLESPEFEKAIGKFDQVLAADNDFHGSALWHLGLCQLMMQEKDEATRTLNLVRENFPSHSERAASILSDLE